MGSWRAGCVETRTAGSEERAGEPGRPKRRYRAPARPLQGRPCGRPPPAAVLAPAATRRPPRGAGLLAGERGACFGGQVDEGFAADVDEDAFDGAADERPGRVACVVVGDWLGPGASDDQAAAAQSELAGLRPDRILTELLVADIETEGALGGHGVALLFEGGGQDDVAAWDGLVGLDDLLELPDEVVDVLEPAILHVQGVAAEPRALGEDDAASFRRLDLHLGGDRVGAVADVGGNRLGHLRPAGVVDVAGARLGELGPLGAQNLNGAA